MHTNSKKGFTLIELLVVIAIIGMLSSIVFASLNTARVKGRDARRQSDMNQIFTALNLYFDAYGCLPVTTGSTCGVASGGAYSQANSGGWDYSSQGPGFLTFLKTAGFLSTVPVDPINNMTGDNSPAGTYAYKYYCYNQGAPNPAYGVTLGYISERTGAPILKSQSVLKASDNPFPCK